VVSGYLSGVGITIIASQIPILLGATKGVHFWQALAMVEMWKWQSIIVGIVTIVVMLAAPKLTKAVPAAIIALLAGVATYFVLGLADSSLLTLSGNRFVVGSLGGGGSFTNAMTERWMAMNVLGIGQFIHLAFPALTLAVLLSIDTLKTCVVLDALTHSRHNSNRELVAQGLANTASALIGGIPGAGTMGATLVNISSGAISRLSGIFEGALALLAFLVLGSLISWVPVAALAAILIVIGIRMIDRHCLQFLKQRSTILDFAVIVAVVITALTASLITASGVGIVLALLLFVREQVGGNVVRRKLSCSETFSKRVRTHDEMEILLAHGERGIVVELQGSLFFGTTNKLYLALNEELKSRDFVILDMRRVQSVDVTAAHMLDQMKDMLAERNGYLIFSQLPKNLPSGRDMEQYFDQIGLVRAESPVPIFGELDEALEWVEDHILAGAYCELGEVHALRLNEIELFKGRKAETLAALERCMEKRAYKVGESIFKLGEAGDQLFLIRKGAVRIFLPISEKQSHHLGTFGSGAFFGEMSFLDGNVRSANAVAFSDTELYVLSRKTFDLLAEEHRKLGMILMEALASVLASRLRYTNAELRVLES
jgi:SulP family sulfate permease